MTRELSQQIKGIAILMMLFLHLFNRPENVALCKPWIFIDGEPLVYLLRKALDPVPFFLILSGYGMFKTENNSLKHRLQRLLTLMIHYWIILALFVFIGSFLRPEVYPGTITDIIGNFTTYTYTYNGELWFMFPYIVLALASPLYFKLVRKCNSLIILLLSFGALHFQSWFAYHFTDIVSSHQIFYNIQDILKLQFYFTLGALAAKCHIFTHISKIRGKYYVTLLGIATIIALIYFKVFLSNDIFSQFYAFLVICAINLINISGNTARTLTALGKASLNMWFIHSWFCYHLFHDFIYAFQYPLLIFAVLLTISYVCAIVADKLIKPITRLAHDRLKPLI